MIIAWLDNLLHRIGIHWSRICDAHDIRLGVPDTPENFPRRHGFVRLHHIYTGASGEDAGTCRHCGKSIEESGPCLLVSGATE